MMQALCIKCKIPFDADANPHNKRTCGNHTVSKIGSIEIKQKLYRQKNTIVRIKGDCFLNLLRIHFQDPIYQLKQCYWIDVS